MDIFDNRIPVAQFRSMLTVIFEEHLFYLIQSFSIDIDAVHFQHFVIDRQQSSHFRQTPRHQPGNEDSRNLLQSRVGLTHADSVSYEKAQRFVLCVFQQLHSSKCFWDDVDVYDSCNLSEFGRFADDRTYLQNIIINVRVFAFKI